jgi:ketosteroid isomerase-like protein
VGAVPSRDAAIEVIERLHAAQARLYGSGDASAARDVLTEDVVWIVPGSSPIAGVYRGREEVVRYMLARGALADGTFVMHRGDALSGDGDSVAVLTDGTAVVGGVERRWSTVGLYRLRGDRVAECRLVPFDQAEFDEIWSAAGELGAGGRDQRRSTPRPGHALVALAVGHTAWGALAYRDALREITRAGFVDSVGDGLFARRHAVGERAAGFWFMFASPLVALLGYQLDRATRAGDADAVTTAGWSVLAVSAVGAAIIPRSGFPAGIATGLWTIRRGRRLRAGSS